MENTKPSYVEFNVTKNGCYRGCCAKGLQAGRQVLQNEATANLGSRFGLLTQGNSRFP
jgi:hypothetical protein